MPLGPVADAPISDDLLAGPVDDPIWLPDPDAAADALNGSPTLEAGERVVAIENAVPTGRLRRLVGSAAAVLALGVAIGGGAVASSAQAGSIDATTTPEATDTGATTDPAPPADTTDAPPPATTDTAPPPPSDTAPPSDTTPTDTTPSDPAPGDPPSGTTAPPSTPTDADGSATHATATTSGGKPAPSKSRLHQRGSHATTPGHVPQLRSGRRIRVRHVAGTGGAAPTTTPRTVVPGASAAPVAPIAIPSQLRFPVAAPHIHRLPALRTISHRMAVRLVMTAGRTRVGWAVLAASRTEAQVARGLGSLAGLLAGRGVSPASTSATATSALVAVVGSDQRATQTRALAAFYGALGTGGLQNGLGWETPYLRRRVLRDQRVSIYPGGRRDVAAGRVDTRVLMVIEYLANATGKVRVSSLVSGHRRFTTSGAVDAHLYGRAVDIAALGGTPIRGHEGPHTVTERAVRLLVMLPADVAPRQVISLMDVDGPTGNHGSFALPDHSGHIHIGY